MSNNINKTAIKKLLKTVDTGLCYGIGEPVPGFMCVEAAVCYALGLPHGDDPNCVGWAVRKAMISLNDSDWASNAARAKGLRKLAVAQLGSDQLDQARFAELVALKVIQRMCPLLFSGLAKLAKTDEDQEVMESAGRACAEATSLQEAALILASARASARVSDSALDRALDRALDLYIAHTFADGRALVLSTSLDLARAIGIAIALDETLEMLAGICLEVLVEMESPGCQWLGLCEGGPCCKVCGSEMRGGVTLVNGVRFSEDFAGDLCNDGVTMSEGPSDGALVPCIKCIECGHSFIP